MTCESWLKPSLILNLRAGDEPEDEPGIENLRGYGDLVDWGRRVGLLAEDEVGRLLDEAARSLEEVGSVHARALELRGGIYEVCRAVAEGERPPSAAMEHLHRVEGEAISRGRLVPGEVGFDWEWPTESTSRSAVGRGARSYRASEVTGSEPGEAVRRLPLVLLGRQPQPDPALVHRGRVRHAREGPPLRREARRQAQPGVTSRTFGVVHPW